MEDVECRLFKEGELEQFVKDKVPEGHQLQTICPEKRYAVVMLSVCPKCEHFDCFTLIPEMLKQNKSTPRCISLQCSFPHFITPSMVQVAHGSTK